MTKNFSEKEMECKCGCRSLPRKESVERLQRLRDLLGSPLIVTSAMRCDKHNKAVGGAANSQHTTGRAFDIRVNNAEEMGEIFRAAEKCGFNAIGIAKTFIHIDDRPTDKLLVWGY